MMPDRARIQQLVPHAGAMCLLDAVTEWDELHIACRSAAPSGAHPLARDGKLPAIAAAEYAAQATAVHGALLDGGAQPQAGMLAKLMDVDLHSVWFPVACDVLDVCAKLISRTPGGCLYSFSVAAANEPIANGRLMVAFAPATVS